MRCIGRTLSPALPANTAPINLKAASGKADVQWRWRIARSPIRDARVHPA